MSALTLARNEKAAAATNLRRPGFLVFDNDTTAPQQDDSNDIGQRGGANPARGQSDDGRSATGAGRMTQTENSNTVALDALAEQINIGHGAYLATARKALGHALDVGAALLEAKAGLPHGEWLPWLGANCPAISERTAQRYIRLAKNKNKVSKSDTVADLTVRQAEKSISEVSLVPPDGHGLVAKWQGGEAYVWPSTYTGYYFFAVVYEIEECDGKTGFIAEGNGRPIRSDGLARAFGRILHHHMPTAAKFEAVPAVPWRHHLFLGRHDPVGGQGAGSTSQEGGKYVTGDRCELRFAADQP